MNLSRLRLFLLNSRVVVFGDVELYAVLEGYGRMSGCDGPAMR